MYANTRNPLGGYQPSKAGPGSLGIAIGINVALVGGLLYAAPVVDFTPPRGPITIIDVPLDPPPVDPPKPVDPKIAVPNPRPQPPIDAPETIFPLPPTDRFIVPDLPPVPIGPNPIKTPGTGTGITIDPPKPPPPLLVQPGIDPRYADEFQPVYPSDERRAGRDGRVVVRALVGVDGRVKQLERLTATSDSFWRTTLDRALRRWRFTPGTRDGIPVEAWRTMTLTFRMED